MPTFTKQTEIDAPVESVWRVLADIGSIADWNPGVVESHTTSDDPGGLGAGRRCDLGGNNFLDEEVVEWDDERTLTMRVTGTNLPLVRADIRFTLDKGDEKTQVFVSPDYTLKYGALGKAFDAVFVRRTYEKGMAALLEGLKRHVESDLHGASD